ncbi:TVB5 protein, partial [Amia calva]|nr:TVB5 protein [Amia calva]
SVTVQQSLTVFKNPGEAVQLNCNHDESSSNYDKMYWYQQVGNGALRLIGYIYVESVTMEKEFIGKYNLSGDGRKEFFLQTFVGTVAFSTMYFCAASQHSAADPLFPLQKPS